MVSWLDRSFAVMMGHGFHKKLRLRLLNSDGSSSSGVSNYGRNCPEYLFLFFFFREKTNIIFSLAGFLLKTRSRSETNRFLQFHLHLYPPLYP